MKIYVVFSIGNLDVATEYGVEVAYTSKAAAVAHIGTCYFDMIKMIDRKEVDGFDLYAEEHDEMYWRIESQTHPGLFIEYSIEETELCEK